MNISIKNLNNCEKLKSNKILDMVKKADMKLTNEIETLEDTSDTDTKIKVCKSIDKTVNDINPCGVTLYDDTKLSIKKHQLSVANHLIKNRGVIVVHSVGTGKTLSAISTAQCLLIRKIINHVIVITPTSLQENFKTQAKMYGISAAELDNLYTFYTIQGISNSIENNDVKSATNSLVIIDEAHNLRTIGGTRFDNIFKYVKKSFRVMLLTATPLINYKHDIINLVSLINGEKPISVDKFEGMIDKLDRTEFKNYVSNIFSFYIKDQTKPDPNFPSKKILEVFLPMDPDYYKTYIGVENGQTSKIPDFRGKNIHVFYNGLRRASNIIDKKSPKVDWIIDKIKSESKSKFVIFSHFINMGLKPIMKWLESRNKKYRHVTGDLSIEERKTAVEDYNDGKVSILLISKSGGEGLDLKGTNYIIIMEPSWNENAIEQIIGRGVRYKSHEGLSKSKQNVTIYRLYCVKPEEYKSINKITSKFLLEFNGNMLSVDLYLRNYAWLKQQEIISFYKILNKFKIE